VYLLDKKLFQSSLMHGTNMKILFVRRVPHNFFLIKKVNMSPKLNTFVRVQPVAVNKMGECRLSEVGVVDINWYYVRKRNISLNGSKIYFMNKEQIEVRECLLSFGAESFVFHFAIQKYKY